MALENADDWSGKISKVTGPELGAYQDVVVGLPRQMNGALGPAAENAQHFIEKLRPLISCEVVTWDERLSTVAAERALREAGKKTRETRGIRDQVAAQIILQGYLDRLNA